jgi:rhodanese-related sulfurtransferase
LECPPAQPVSCRTRIAPKRLKGIGAHAALGGVELVLTTGSRRADVTMACVQNGKPLEVDLDTFAEAHADGATVLDVRNPDEYEAAHVPGALLIPLGELVERQDEIPEAEPLYVICAVGGRSLAAAKALVDAGYDAVSVVGGTNGWIERGGDVITGAAPN